MTGTPGPAGPPAAGRPSATPAERPPRLEPAARPPRPSRPRGTAVLEEIVARATPLHERLAAGWQAAPAEGRGAADRDADRELLARWRDRAAAGDRAAFERRLAWSGWRPADAERCLAPGRPPPGAPAPGWASTLREICRLARSEDAGRLPEPPPDRGRPIPFEELFAPHVTVARRRLRRRLAAAGVSGEVLTGPAWGDAEWALIGRLSQLGSGVLLAEFDRFRGGPVDGLSMVLAEGERGGGAERYRAFVAGQLAAGLLGLYSGYPVLARLTATAVDLWVDDTAELAGRVAADAALLERTFGDGPTAAASPSPWGPVARLTTGLSDPHHGGRTVRLLSWPDGRRLVYKPKRVALEAAFTEFLRWCNERGTPLPFAPHRALDQGEYGWSEFVGAEACADERAVERFHRRAGMLLCILYALGASDCHFENLVARGEQLELIDMEAVVPIRMAKWLPKADEGEGWYAAAALLGGSVVATGMLPRWHRIGRAGELLNVGGLGGGLPRTKLDRVWYGVNGDRMGRLWRRVPVAVQPNVPHLRGQPQSPADHASAVVAGFREQYRWLLDHRAELRSPAGPLRALVRGGGRLVFRPTHAYGALLEKSWRPESLRDGAAFGVEIDALSRVFLGAARRPRTWPLLDAEVSALERADVPAFVAEGRHLRLGDGVRLERFFAGAAADGIGARLAQLDEVDLELQSALLRVSLSALAPDSGAGAPAVARAAAPAAKSYTAEQLVDAARSLAARLGEHAIPGADGSVSWLGPEVLPPDDHFQLVALGPHLYDGTAGIALFLAALARVTGDDEPRRLAAAALAPVRHKLRRLAQDPPAADRLGFGLGGMIGVGSLVYSLTAVGRLLGERALVDEAWGGARLISEDLVARDRHLDVVQGVAGAILALLALEDAAPAMDSGPGPLPLARLCARHLLAHRTSHEGRPEAWVTSAGVPLTGFSHGAAGISYALLRLYARTGERELWDAAAQGMAYERSHYDPRVGNWRDLRSGGGRFATRWCHGAPGIALARLGALAIADDAEIRAEITAGLAATRAWDAAALDHLCCGTLGLAEILAYAHARLGDPADLAAARRLAFAALERAEAAGHFRYLPAVGGDFFVPSLFRGAAGVGYALLRLAHPELPCVLLLE